MKKCIAVFFVFCSIALSAQGFSFDKPGKSKVTIPFKLINNLIFIDVQVNGVPLTFLLDTGVEETILFSLDDKEEISFLMVEKIMLKGMGTEASVEAMKTSNNRLSIGGLSDSLHDIYIVLDQEFNFSSTVGIPVNGIIGYHFFKNHPVEINFGRKRITVFNERKNRMMNRYEPVDISIEGRKPYLMTRVESEGTLATAKLLIDTGSSDSIWLFAGGQGSIPVPSANFDDFLGRGFSGDIHGKRARIKSLEFAMFEFQMPIASFPDTLSTRNLQLVTNRAGSLGNEILKRFTVVIDYPSGKLLMRKNELYSAPFHYNMSGMEVHHDGMEWVRETVELRPVQPSWNVDVNGEKLPNNFTYKFELKPSFVITEVRPDSPAASVGLQKGDRLISVNGRKSFRFTLEEIYTLFRSEEGKLIEVEVERDAKIMKFGFRLKAII